MEEGEVCCESLVMEDTAKESPILILILIPPRDINADITSSSFVSLSLTADGNGEFIGRQNRFDAFELLLFLDFITSVVRIEVFVAAVAVLSFVFDLSLCQ